MYWDASERRRLGCRVLFNKGVSSLLGRLTCPSQHIGMSCRCFNKLGGLVTGSNCEKIFSVSYLFSFLNAIFSLHSLG